MVAEFNMNNEHHRFRSILNDYSLKLNFEIQIRLIQFLNHSMRGNAY